MMNLILLTMSTILIVSSSSWVMIWAFLEINTLIMCSTISKEMKSNKHATMPSMNYFIIQTSSSLLLIITVNTNLMNSLSTLPLMIIMMKMGSWPFHLWYVKMLSCMEMKSLSMKLLMTWQKIPYFFMIQFFSNLSQIIMLLSMLMIIFPLAKMKKLSMKKILILSSLNNNGWMMISSLYSIQLFLIYFTIYSMSFVMILKFFSNWKNKLTKTKSPTLYNLMVIMNLNSFPPFMLFSAKTMIVISLSKFLSFSILMTMMMSSYLFSYFYMKNSSESFMPQIKTQSQKKNKETYYFLTLISSILSLMMIF